ncbi:hypothetical protein HYR53_10815 [Candidatus Acetothermia bacterium]|nr:hypothetical protein [Candidatus Acetothermia bacterium]
MKRITFSLVLVAALTLSLGGCSLLNLFGQSSPQGTDVHVNQTFTLGLGATAKVMEANLLVTFVDVVEDSRCPVDVTCVWAGNLKVLVKLQEVGRSAQQVELNSTSDPRQVFFGDYRVDFMGAQPPKRSTQDIRKQDYILSLMVKGLK